MKLTKKIIALVLVLATAASICACGKKVESTGACEYYETWVPEDEANVYYAAMTLEGCEPIVLLLDGNEAPRTVENFLKLANSGFYDGLTFHRVMESFMIQGGDPKGDGTGGSSETIFGEFWANLYPFNDLSHKRGVISMARSSAYDSASSQFFICNADSTFLDDKYAAFGYVICGMSIVDYVTEKTARYGDSNGGISDKSLQIKIESCKQITYEEAMELAKSTSASIGASEKKVDSTGACEEKVDSTGECEEKLESTGACEYYETWVPEDEANVYYAAMTLEGCEPIVLLLDGNEAPKTVENFLKLADSGFYNGLTFHRVKKHFMIQGGDPKGDGTGGSSETILGEFSANLYPFNDLSHKRGVISMARSSAYDSASSQFFICNADSTFLDDKYAAFGYVICGMSIVDYVTEKTARYGDSNGGISDKSLQIKIESCKQITYEEAMELAK